MTHVADRSMTSSASDLAMFAACFAKNDSPRPLESLDWQYRKGPTARTFVDISVADEAGQAPRLAAIYATLPLFLRVAGERRLAVQSLDTLTDRDFRGKGLFVRLAEATYERAANEGAACVYGFPNGNSAPGFFGKLGWRSLDPIPFLIRPLRSRYVAARLKLAGAARLLPDVRLAPRSPPRVPSGATLVEVDRFDERFTDLWTDFARDIGVAVDRDAAYLNWRLVEKPGESYRRVALVHAGRVTAFVAFSLKEKHGGCVGYVMELLHARSFAEHARFLLALATAELVRQGADVALAWALRDSPNFSTYLRSGFLPFPERLRPIELHFGVRAFDRSVARVLEDRANWYLSYLDSDTV